MASIHAFGLDFLPRLIYSDFAVFKYAVSVLETVNLENPRRFKLPRRLGGFSPAKEPVLYHGYRWREGHQYPAHRGTLRRPKAALPGDCKLGRFALHL